MPSSRAPWCFWRQKLRGPRLPTRKQLLPRTFKAVEGGNPACSRDGQLEAVVKPPAAAVKTHRDMLRFKARGAGCNPVLKLTRILSGEQPCRGGGGPVSASLLPLETWLNSQGWKGLHEIQPWGRARRGRGGVRREREACGCPPGERSTGGSEAFVFDQSCARWEMRETACLAKLVW
ncbi:hypothetical protein VCV18_000258 [Metarhizium anisopliae]